MRQLTSLDAQFLALENARQTGHVGGLAIVDPSTAPSGRLGIAEITRLLEQRGAQLPPLHWRLAEVPFGMDYPYWVDEGELRSRLSHPRAGARCAGHRRAARRAGGADHVAPARPRAPAVGAVRDRRARIGASSAILTKIHHAVIDGLSGGGDHGPAARPDARGARAAAARGRRPAPRSRAARRGDVRARPARPAALPGAHPARAADGDPAHRPDGVRRSSRAPAP